MWYINYGDECMNELLMYLSSGLIIVSFLLYFLLILINRNKKITNSDGFNITKDILSEYDSINIVENNSYFTIYNIKRRVIRIASRCYYGNSLSDIAVPLIEAGISGIDNNKNKVINIFRSIVPNLKCLYILSILAVFINGMTFNISDAKTSLIFLIFFSTVNYFIINIKTDALIWIDKHINKIKDIKKEDKNKIINLINNFIIFDKLLFISELIMIIRFIAIIINK